MSTSQEAPRIVVLNAGLAPSGLTQVLSRAALDAVARHGGAGEHLDVQDERVLPYFEEGSDGAEHLRERLQQAEGVIICFPVYNFNMNATLKSVIEHCGPGLTGKVVGLMATAGGRFGYMSVLSVVQSLMFDLRAWIVPRQVYAVTEDFEESQIISEDVRRRVDQLAQDTTDMARRLR
jgi:NAD(P)H-dependent FMN reductase